MPASRDRLQQQGGPGRGMAAGKSIPPMAVEAASSSADHGAGHGKQPQGHGGGHGSGGGGYETPNAGYMWLGMCFLGIMASFIVYGIVMEYATSGGRELHELSMIFLTSLMYSVTAYYCRRVNREVWSPYNAGLIVLTSYVMPVKSPSAAGTTSI